MMFSSFASVSDMNEGASLTFKFDVQKSTTVYIYINFAKRTEAYNINSCFTVTVTAVTDTTNIDYFEIYSSEQIK